MGKYLERISASKEERAKGTNERAAKAAEQQLSVDIFTVEGRITDLTQKVEDTKGQVPFNASNIIQLVRTLGEANEDLTALKALKTELFA